MRATERSTYSRDRSRRRAARLPRRNRFVKNAGLDVSVSNANAGTAPIRVDAAGNYWGGGPPVMAPAAPGAPKPSGGAADVAISGNVTFTPPTHLTSDPAR